jgi:hypothetical protein
MHPAMMEGIAARLLCWQCGLTGWNEARQRVDSHPGESQERGGGGGHHQSECMRFVHSAVGTWRSACVRLIAGVPMFCTLIELL